MIDLERLMAKVATVKTIDAMSSVDAEIMALLDEFAQTTDEPTNKQQKENK